MKIHGNRLIYEGDDIIEFSGTQTPAYQSSFLSHNKKDMRGAIVELLSGFIAGKQNFTVGLKGVVYSHRNNRIFVVFQNGLLFSERAVLTKSKLKILGVHPPTQHYVYSDFDTLSEDFVNKKFKFPK